MVQMDDAFYRKFAVLEKNAAINIQLEEKLLAFLKP